VSGRILRLSVKAKTPGEHGLPKSAVSELRVTSAGAEGDYNHYRTRQLAGDPDQAILLLTDDNIAQLRTEGWPVHPGDLGENITLTQIADTELRPGNRVQLGEVILEVTRECDPCTELHSLPYVGSVRGPEFVRTMMHRRGWYARVLVPGPIQLDTPVSVRVASGHATPAE
jgi:MOSC domain-containing protein YiiM